MKRMRIVTAALAAFLAALAVVGGCGSRTQTPPPNIVVGLVDALRRDHVGCYGYERDTSPFFDAGAASGLRFADCIAHAPWTAPSVASIFTSRYPTQSGVGALEDSSGLRNVHRNSASALPDEALTLAELLSAAGYRTFSIGSNPFASLKFGMAQGFDRVVTDARHASKVVDVALAILEDFDSGTTPDAAPARPFFGYLHFMDVHAPNRPPRRYYNKYPTADGAPHRVEHRDGNDKDVAGLTAEELAVFKSHKVALYDGSLNYVDDQVGRFAAALRERGLLENTVFVVMADHGEGLWDHGLHMGHGFSLYAELVEVPLILFGAGVPVGVVESRVRNIDVAPTLLGLAGVPAPEGFEGSDLLRLRTEGRIPDLPAFSEDISYGFEQKALHAGGFKFIHRLREGESDLLFDKRADPDELVDILATDPATAAGMSARLDSLLASLDKADRRGVVVDEATRRQLRALGY